MLCTESSAHRDNLLWYILRQKTYVCQRAARVYLICLSARTTNSVVISNHPPLTPRPRNILPACPPQGEGSIHPGLLGPTTPPLSPPTRSFHFQTLLPRCAPPTLHHSDASVGASLFSEQVSLLVMCFGMEGVEGRLAADIRDDLTLLRRCQMPES